MHTDTVSISQFLTDNRITMTAERTDRNPSMDDGANMDHWKVVFTRKVTATLEGYIGTRNMHKTRTYTSKMTTHFSMAYGHNGKEPTAGDVLDCLASDASSIENARSFEEWAGDFGYDADSRKAEKTFKACEHAAGRLKAFLGGSLYDVLLWHTERE